MSSVTVSASDRFKNLRLVIPTEGTLSAEGNEYCLADKVDALLQQYLRMHHLQQGKALGGGKYATVYELIDTHTAEKRAIKIFYSQENLRYDEKRGHHLAFPIEHSRIVSPEKILYFEKDALVEEPTNPSPLVATIMPLVNGTDLHRLTRQKPFSAEQTLNIGLQLAEILKVLNKENIAHRDLKPDNVLLDEAGDVYLLDFDLARLYDSESGTETPIGTQPFIAPERVLRQQESPEKRDVWSLGMLLYYIHFGKVPLKELIGHSKMDSFHLPEHCPASVGTILRATLKHNPEERADVTQTLELLESQFSESSL